MSQRRHLAILRENRDTQQRLNLNPETDLQSKATGTAAASKDDVLGTDTALGVGSVRHMVQLDAAEIGRGEHASRHSASRVAAQDSTRYTAFHARPDEPPIVPGAPGRRRRAQPVVEEGFLSPRAAMIVATLVVLVALSYFSFIPAAPPTPTMPMSLSRVLRQRRAGTAPPAEVKFHPTRPEEVTIPTSHQRNEELGAWYWRRSFLARAPLCSSLCLNSQLGHGMPCCRATS